MVTYVEADENHRVYINDDDIYTDLFVTQSSKYPEVNWAFEFDKNFILNFWDDPAKL